MDNNRSEILAQLASGQISADQAAEQLRGASPAAEPPKPPPTPEPVPAASGASDQSAALANRWLRIRVSDLESGRQRVSVNLPMSWLAVGLRIGAHFSPEVAALDPNELMNALQSSPGGQMVDVEDLDDGQRVQIFVE